MPQKKTTAGSGRRKSGKPKTPAKKSAKSENSFLPQITPLILAAAAVLIAVCVIVDQGVVGHGLRDVLAGLFGGAVYALPVLLLIRAIFLRRDREEGRAFSRSVSACAFAVCFAMLLHVLASDPISAKQPVDPGQYYDAGKLLAGGGAVGGIPGQLLLEGFGRVFGLIVLISALLFVGLYIAGVSPRGVAVAVAYHADRLIEACKARRAAEKEKREQSGPSRSQVKEEEYLGYLREKRAREREAKIGARDAVQPSPAKKPKNGQKTGPAQIPMNTEAAGRTGEIFHVKKRRLTELDVPVSGPSPEPEKKDEHLIGITGRPDSGNRGSEADPDTGWASDAFRAPDDLTDPVQAELASADADSEAVDEKIFDEVMRRNREKNGSGRKTGGNSDPASLPAAKVQTVVSGGVPIPENNVPRSSSASSAPVSEKKNAGKPAGSERRGPAISEDAFAADFGPDPEPENDFNDAGETGDEGFDSYEGIDEAVAAAALENIRHRKDHAQKTKPADSAPKPKKPDSPAPDDTSTSALVTGMAGDGDNISDIFLNPEDAALLDKLSEQYRNPLEVKRETVSAPEPPKPAAPAALPYRFPPLDLLTEDPGGVSENIRDELQENAVKLVDTLKSFRVNTKIENISRGPTITRYELVPEPGTKVRSITNLVDDIALNLATTGVRIEAPIPGKSAVGIEVPNKKRTTVHLRTLLETEAFQNAKSRLTVALGEDVAGDAVYFDIGKMPHLLIAGTTGSGKSVCINTIIMSLLYKASPDDVKMILVDPKKVELNIYNGIPHLLVPVVSEPKKAAGALSWAVSEMERRYEVIEDAGKRNIGEYNKLASANPDYEYLPSIVIIIDELADLMMTAPDDVEDSICRIAQKARAAGMYLIVGTQRPSVDVITGLIKANIPSRIAFRTSNQVDSRTIIDIGSAANLIGMGDMLFAPVGAMKPSRVQGAFVSEDDVLEAVTYIRTENNVAEGYDDEIVNQIEREAQKCGTSKKGAGGASADESDFADSGDEDPMLNPAIEVALDAGKISTSLIQRKLKLGYGRAAKLIDRMEQLGYVSAPNGPHPREVRLTRSEWQEIKLRGGDEPPFDL